MARRRPGALATPGQSRRELRPQEDPEFDATGTTGTPRLWSRTKNALPGYCGWRGARRRVPSGKMMIRAPRARAVRASSTMAGIAPAPSDRSSRMVSKLFAAWPKNGISISSFLAMKAGRPAPGGRAKTSPIAHVLGGNDAGAWRDVLKAGHLGSKTDDELEKPKAGRDPIARKDPANAGAPPAGQQGDRADKDGQESRLGQKQGIEQPGAQRLKRHRDLLALFWWGAHDAMRCRKRRTVMRDVMAVSAAITGTTARMPMMPSTPSAKRPNSTPSC